MEKVAENYFRLRCRNSGRYLCVREDELALCRKKKRADQFSEDLIECTLPLAEVLFATGFRQLRVPDRELDLRRMHGVIDQ